MENTDILRQLLSDRHAVQGRRLCQSRTETSTARGPRPSTGIPVLEGHGSIWGKLS